ncbi:NAD(P)H-dependent glycerol-3-phosphate dehydrogenase [Halocynthiibacter namhaensis]|uniref:NAD(P)H-dependent glycerol-3-phosphate dehydrogenase n=1 Tax=Halocynthiibacter namhaensis TaxID=1290553 RepID=UPI0005799274|nr:NAD(P)H-dependent glycerol-3-phosphate dehydrogenase [Halocynthiibacter namhaensis]
MTVSVIGAGAFGTALAQSHAADGRDVTIWARSEDTVLAINSLHENTSRLAGVRLSPALRATSSLREATQADKILMCLPMQKLGQFLRENKILLQGKTLIGCCKGIELESLSGTSALLQKFAPDSVPAILTGPGFARDIAGGLPTAMTLACADKTAPVLQQELSTSVVRLYLTDDMVGAELGGALKNVVAIACGAVIGAGLGESARAAIMTRGFSEMQRLAVHLGANPETLTGLSGFGDLTLTCSSDQSRNYKYGFDVGAGKTPDPKITTEGVATARAVAHLAKNAGVDLPLTQTVAALTLGEITLAEAAEGLLSRPLRKE